MLHDDECDDDEDDKMCARDNVEQVKSSVDAKDESGDLKTIIVVSSLDG